MTQINKNSADNVNNEYKHSELTAKIIACFYKVYNKLGYGFLEKVYEKALLIELQKAGLKASNQIPVKVHYDEYIIGDYTADILVENKVFVENKTSVSLCEEDEFQLINYLKATDIEVGLLFNFGKKPEVRRKAFSNVNKNLRSSNESA